MITGKGDCFGRLVRWHFCGRGEGQLFSWTCRLTFTLLAKKGEAHKLDLVRTSPSFGTRPTNQRLVGPLSYIILDLTIFLHAFAKRC